MDSLTKLYWLLMCFSIRFSRYVLLASATEDILAGSLHSTAVVLIVYSVPDIFSKVVVSPWLVRRFSFLPVLILFSSLNVGCQLVFVFINDVKVRLAGMCVLGLADGFGSIAIAKLLGFYREATAMYQCGDNCAAAIAGVYYTGLTVWGCVSSQNAIAIQIALPLLPVLIFVLLDKEPLQDLQNNELKNITYKPLKHDDKKHSKSRDGSENRDLTGFRSLFYILSKYFPFVYYISTTYFLIQMSMTAILTTMTFQSSPFLPRDHYLFYRLLGDVGIIVGGIEVPLVLCICPRFLDTIKIRRIWIAILLNVSHLIVFLAASWYRFTENVYIILFLCFTQGVVVGLTYIHVRVLAADLFLDSRILGNVLGYIEVGTAVGRIAAALLGIFVEQYLRQHCTGRLLLGRFCLARYSSTTMWKTSSCELH